ncbi:MAG: APC family permease [Isosphaeraceae bacterium]
MSQPEEVEAPGSQGAMPAEFGLPTATFLIVASMVGVGVLTTSGFTVANVGSNQLMLWLWVLGGVVAACGALTLCELTAAMPRTGGDYVYLHEAYGPLVAFLSGWVSFLIGFAAPAASAAFGSAKYLTAPLNLEPNVAGLSQRILATVLILTFVAVHLTSRRQTARVQGLATAVKLALLVAFMIAGLIAGRSGYSNLLDRPPIDWDRGVAMTFSLIYITYAYIGWNSASYLAGEFVDPQRQLPRAILLGTLGVVVLYLGLNVVYALALSAAEVQGIARAKGFDAVAPIADLAARKLFSERWSAGLSVSVGLMLLSSLSAYTLTGPRVIYAMAVAGHFPSVAGRLTRRGRIPAVATWLQTLVTLAFLWVGTLASLVEYAGIGLSIFSMMAIASIYVLRWKRPDLPRPFRTPGYPFTPAVFLVVTAALTTAAFQQRPWISAYAILSILSGIPVYHLFTRREARPDATPPLARP